MPATVQSATKFPMAPTVVPIMRTKREFPGTATLELDVKAFPGGFPFEPGQFNMLYVFGVGEAPISISGDPAKSGRLVHTVRKLGMVTAALYGMRKGETLGLRGPFGSAWPLAAAEGGDLLFVAGGLGLAPLRPAIHVALTARNRYGRIALIYGTRSPKTRLFAAELRKWGQRRSIATAVTVDSAPPGWTGHVGVVTSLFDKVPFDPARTTAFMCGPEIMMRFAANALQDIGVTPDRLHLSMERNMKCAIAQCGHCQFGPHFLCKDGPVFRYDRIQELMAVREL